VGDEIVCQRGSHLRLRHPASTRQPLTVPDHADLKTGLLRALIRDAGMSVEEFLEALRR
jgi:predicted RNA binding protein YcfA (HicA-like mRNA interferase family)